MWSKKKIQAKNFFYNDTFVKSPSSLPKYTDRFFLPSRSSRLPVKRQGSQEERKSGKKTGRVWHQETWTFYERIPK